MLKRNEINLKLKNSAKMKLSKKLELQFAAAATRNHARASVRCLNSVYDIAIQIEEARALALLLCKKEGFELPISISIEIDIWGKFAASYGYTPQGDVAVVEIRLKDCKVLALSHTRKKCSSRKAEYQQSLEVTDFSKRFNYLASYV